MKDVKAKWEAPSPQKWDPALQKHEIILPFFFFAGFFALLDPDPYPVDQNQSGSGSTYTGLNLFDRPRAWIIYFGELTSGVSADTSLNFTQTRKLISEVRPRCLVVPERYTRPPPSAPNRYSQAEYIGNHFHIFICDVEYCLIICFVLPVLPNRACVCLFSIKSTIILSVVDPDPVDPYLASYLSKIQKFEEKSTTFYDIITIFYLFGKQIFLCAAKLSR